MRLPNDIIGLIFTYGYQPQLVHWIEQAHLINSDTGDFSILSNPAAINWLYKNSQEIIRIGVSGILNRIAKNQTPHVIKLLNIFSGNDYWSNSSDIVSLLTTNPYGYKYVINQPVLSIQKLFHGDMLMHITQFPIPELIEKYREFNDDPNLSENYRLMNGLATNPYTWDIFISIVNYNVPDTLLYRVAANTSKGAIQYMTDNLDRFTKMVSIYSVVANPSAYSIIRNWMESGSLLEYNKYININLCENTNPEVIKLLGIYPEYINNKLSANPLDVAVDILFARPELIDYTYLASNTNPRVLPLIKANYHKLTKEGKRNLYANPLIFSHRAFNNRVTRKIQEKLVASQVAKCEYHRAELEANIKLAKELGSMMGN